MPPRSKAFSGSKKKQQLQKKREKKRGQVDSGSDDDHPETALDPGQTAEDVGATPAVVTSFGGKADSPEARLSSLFMREDDAAVAARRSRGSDPVREPAKSRRQLVAKFIDYSLAIDSTEKRPDDSCAEVPVLLPHPVRPDWPAGISAAQLERREDAYFAAWCEDTYKRINTQGSEGADVAPFELNLEVWRQLWRVIEQSDVIVLIVDVRYPTYHIAPSLVREVTVKNRMPLVIALNKVDLVHEAFVQRWKKYLTKALPGVGLVEFCSRPIEDPPGGERGAGGVAARRKWLCRRCRQADLDSHLESMARSLMSSVLEKCREAAANSWSEKPGERPAIAQAQSTAQADKEATTETDEEAVADAKADGEADEDAAPDTEADQAAAAEGEAKPDGDAIALAEVDLVVEAQAESEEKADVDHLPHSGKGPGGALSIGLIGHPNVGKTSVLNALAGRKAASVSGTAGHTKHLQHIRVQEDLHVDAYVIDCPGLVFPSFSTRADAELNGLLPLAQVRETMSAMRQLAESLPLPSLLGLKLPDWYDDGEPWTPMAICEAYAEKHRYVFARSGRPDVHRAGLEIMKDCKDGSILLLYEPPPADAE